MNYKKRKKKIQKFNFFGDEKLKNSPVSSELSKHLHMAVTV